MGRGDNRRTPKMKRRKAMRKLVERIKRRIAGGSNKTPEKS